MEFLLLATVSISLVVSCINIAFFGYGTFSSFVVMIDIIINIARAEAQLTQAIGSVAQVILPSYILRVLNHSETNHVHG